RGRTGRRAVGGLRGSAGRQLAQHWRVAIAARRAARSHRDRGDAFALAYATLGRLAIRTHRRNRRAVDRDHMAIAERQVEIVNPLGLHARPSAEFVKLASQFTSEVQVSKDGLDVNGKSIMGVMTLAAECGSQLIIKTEGDDAEAACSALA